MPFTLTAVNCPTLPVFSGIYLPTAAPLTSPTILQGETTNARPKVNEGHTRADLTARFGGGGYAVVHGLDLSAGAGLTLNIAAGQAQINGAVTIPSATTASLTDAGRNWIWLSQAGAVTVVFNSLTPPAGAQALLGSALTSGGAISSVDQSGVMYLKGGIARRTTADATTPGDTPPSQLQFHHFGTGSTHWFWNGTAYYNLAGLTSPVAVADGGTGATTAAGARANLAAMYEAQLTKSVNGNLSLTGAETLYSQIELQQGTVAAPWTLTFPSAATMSSAGLAPGHFWLVRNDTNYAAQIDHSGGNTRYLPEQSQGWFYWDGTDFHEVNQNYPQYAALVASGGDYNFTHFGQQQKALIEVDASGANRILNFVGNTGSQRGRFWALRNDNDSSVLLTAKTSAADTNFDTLLMPGEVQLAVMLADGVLTHAPSRPYTRAVAADFAADADKTLSVLEYGAFIMRLTDSGTLLTVGRNVILPTANHKLWIVVNATAQILTFKTSGGTGAAVAAGTTAIVRGDGTNIVRVTADA